MPIAFTKTEIKYFKELVDNINLRQSIDSARNLTEHNSSQERLKNIAGVNQVPHLFKPVTKVEKSSLNNNDAPCTA